MAQLYGNIGPCAASDVDILGGDDLGYQSGSYSWEIPGSWGAGNTVVTATPAAAGYTNFESSAVYWDGVSDLEIDIAFAPIPPLIDFHGSGGDKVGGTSPSGFLHILALFVGAGGDKVGGTSPWSIVQIKAAVVGAGGDKDGGSSAWGPLYIKLWVAGSGGDRDGGWAWVGRNFITVTENGGPGLGVGDLVEAQQIDYDADANQIVNYLVQGVVTDTSVDGQFSAVITSGADSIAQFGQGMQFIRKGNTSNTARQQAVEIDGLNGRVAIHKGVSKFADWDDITKQPVIVGVLDGLADPVYGDLTGYDALFRGNIIVDGQIISRTGSQLDGAHVLDNTVMTQKLAAAARPYATSVKFSATSDTQVSWTSGTIQVAGGAGFTINSGSISGLTATVVYIYFPFILPPGGGRTLLTTTDISVATADGNIIMCVCHNAGVTGMGAVYVPSIGTDAQDGVFNTLNVNYATIGSLSAYAIAADVIAVGGAAGDVNSGSTKIAGGSIETSTLILVDAVAYTHSMQLTASGLVLNNKTYNTIIGDNLLQGHVGMGNHFTIGFDDNTTSVILNPAGVTFKDNSSNYSYPASAFGSKSSAYTGTLYTRSLTINGVTVDVLVKD